MYKIVVIDDNALIRRSIINTIDWENLKCEITGEADDGYSGKELICRTTPDIVITDIKMPGIDGLELTEYVNSNYPETRVIMITGYDEFQYAQKALRMGVFDLILKPIDNNYLIRSVNDVLKRISLNRSSLLEKERIILENKQMGKEINLSYLEIKRKFLMDVIYGNASDISNIDEKSKSLGMGFKRHFVIVIKPSFNKEDIYNHKRNIASFINSARISIEKVEAYFDIEHIDCWLNDCFTVVAILKGYENEWKLMARIKEFYSRFVRALTEAAQIPFIIGISKMKTDINQVRTSYHEAILALNSSFYQTGNCVFYSENNSNYKMFDESVIMKKINMLYKRLRSEEDGTAELKEIFDEIRAMHILDIDYIKNLFVDICMITSQIFCEKCENAILPEKAILEYRKEVGNLKNIDEAFEYLKLHIKSVMININMIKTNNLSLPVQTIINYIKDNYSREISLQEAADLVSLSSGYLCSLIKKETGESFTNLVNKIRVNKAQRLLKETNLRVFEVAGKVGINNYAYFYQLFKKIIGISPIDFKNNHFYEKVSGV